MNRTGIFLLTVILPIFAVLGCSGGNDPSVPNALNVKPSVSNSALQTGTVLWGYYDVEIDIENQTAVAVLDRQAMFTVNVVNFLNAKPSNLTFKINEIVTGADYVDVDIDVSISHPFPGLPQYNGYDVRGIFMGDGGLTLIYGVNVNCASPSDQRMIPDPDDGYGGPDGYTRWYNKPEFSQGGMPLFNYTPGKLAIPGYDPSATLNPYKYFADNLQPTEDLFTWLVANPEKHGVFSSGTKNTRNYYLRFPNAKGVKYGYAVTANWEGNEPQYHPSNAIESVSCKSQYSGNVYYIDESDKGGVIILDLDIFDWHAQPTSGVMEDYILYLESTVQNNIYQLDPPDMTVTGSGDHFCSYHVTVPADNVQYKDGNEYWVIVQYPVYNYSNPYGIPNQLEGTILAAFFRFDLPVGSSPDNLDPVCDLIDGPQTPIGCGVEAEFDATGSYDPDGDPMNFAWDFNDDGIFDGEGDSYSGSPDNPTHTFYESYSGDVCVKVTDDFGGESICCVPVDIFVNTTAKNIDVTNPGTEAKDLCMDHATGDILIVYPNGDVRRYYADDCYQTFTTLNLAPKCEFIDKSPNGSIYEGWSNYWDWTGNGGHWYEYHYNDDGSLIDAIADGWHVGCYDMRAVFTMGPNGDYANDHVYMFYLLTLDGTIGTHLWARRDEQNFSDGSYWRVLQYHYSSDPVPGVDKLWGDWIVSAESDLAGDYIWVVERTECVAARFKIPDGNLYDFQGQYFGEPMVPGDDDTHINDPIDITRDDKNHSILLDRLSTGDYVLKAWSYDDTGTTALGSFGDSSDWDLTPIRIDGCDMDGRVAVLHTDGENAMISVFIDDEIPG
ncbi:MAG: PKD domain-containing protein [bacterium]